MEGDYQVIVTAHSLVLLESRCAECYGNSGGGSIQRDSCCDGGNSTFCPDTCDILLRFCQLGKLSQFPLANKLLGTGCVQTPLSSHFEKLLGNNFIAGEIYQLNEVGSLGGDPVTYYEVGKWVSFSSD